MARAFARSRRRCRSGPTGTRVWRAVLPCGHAPIAVQVFPKRSEETSLTLKHLDRYSVGSDRRFATDPRSKGEGRPTERKLPVGVFLFPRSYDRTAWIALDAGPLILGGYGCRKVRLGSMVTPSPSSSEAARCTILHAHPPSIANRSMRRSSPLGCARAGTRRCAAFIALVAAARSGSSAGCPLIT